MADLAPAPVNASVMETSPGWQAHTGPLNVDFHYHNNGANGSGIRVNGGPAKLDLLGDASFTTWINVTSAVTTDGAADRVFSKRINTLGYFDFVFASNGGLTFESRLTSASTHIQVTTTPIDFTSGWLFLALTRDATTGAVNIYLGTPTSPGLTLIGSGTSQAGNIDSTGADFMIGNVHAIAGFTYTRSPVADFSDFRIHNEVLSSPQLDAIRLESLQSVPEPSTAFLLIVGAFGLSRLRRLF